MRKIIKPILVLLALASLLTSCSKKPSSSSCGGLTCPIGYRNK